MNKEKYLRTPTANITYRDIGFEDIDVLEKLVKTKKLTDTQRHALIRIISMWYSLD